MTSGKRLPIRCYPYEPSKPSGVFTVDHALPKRKQGGYETEASSSPWSQLA